MLHALSFLVSLVMITLASCPTSTYAASEVQQEPCSFAFSGVVLNRGGNPTLTAFNNWLSQHSQYPTNPSYHESYQALSDYLSHHSTCIAWTCSAPFVKALQNNSEQLVAVPLLHGQPLYYSLTITRTNRTETHLADFNNAILAYSDSLSNSGFIAPAYALKKQQIDIKTHFRLLMHTGLHQDTIRAVAAGLADVGNVDSYIYEEFIKQHPDIASKLKVIDRLGPYPFTPIVAGKNIAPETLLRIKQALLGMHKDRQGKVILNQLGLDGFVERPESFYEPVAHMLNELDSQ